DGFATARDAATALDEAGGKEDAAFERDALHVFLARCLALDMRFSPADVGGNDEGPLTLDPIDDIATEGDLAPRIEALRGVLAGYPSNPKGPATTQPPSRDDVAEKPAEKAAEKTAERATERATVPLKAAPTAAAPTAATPIAPAPIVPPTIL